MKLQRTWASIMLVTLFTNCSGPGLEEKGFRVDTSREDGGADQASGLSPDSLSFATRPSNVLLTGVPHIRLTTVYKVNHRTDDSSLFIGSNNFHYRYDEHEGDIRNNWHGHLIPGIEAVYGYNLVNIAHFDVTTGLQKVLYDRPVLIKTFYYPSFTNDTLNDLRVSRNHFLVTVFDDDTNKDGYINPRDLRRIHLFDVNGLRLKAPIPENYSVFSSEYDPANDRMYVFAKLDANSNGTAEEEEPVHIHWIDMKDPLSSGRLY